MQCQIDFDARVEASGSDSRCSIVVVFVGAEPPLPFDAAIDAFKGVQVSKMNPATQKSHASSVINENQQRQKHP
jgi:hypothetical protein